MADHPDLRDFEMPTAREIELDLALSSPSWQALLKAEETQTKRREIIEPRARHSKPVLRPARA